MVTKRLSPQMLAPKAAGRLAHASGVLLAVTDLGVDAGARLSGSQIGVPCRYPPHIRVVLAAAAGRPTMAANIRRRRVLE
jgi:hypothetical protein